MEFQLEYGDAADTIEDCPFWSVQDEDLEQGRASVPNGAEVWPIAARDSAMAEAVRDLYGAMYPYGLAYFTGTVLELIE